VRSFLDLSREQNSVLWGFILTIILIIILLVVLYVVSLFIRRPGFFFVFRRHSGRPS
jgi:hypothetical protein